MQIAIDENLDDSNMVAFQTALLYTTTKGEIDDQCFDKTYCVLKICRKFLGVFYVLQP